MFCFTIQQSKVIAKELIGSRYCDSVSFELRKQITALNEVNELQDSASAKLGKAYDNQSLIIQNQKTMLSDVNHRLVLTEETLKTQRWLKRFFLVGFIVTGVIALAK